ncbi:MAG: NAD(P)-dependent oxidoreductase [Lachnospiraceae bacterium]|jgi:UDP-glucuronate decarboxylase
MIMEAMHNRVLQEDLENICDDPYVQSPATLEKLTGRTILITGATGLLGSLLVRTFAAINRNFGTNCRILALVRNEEKARGIYGDLLLRGDVRLIYGDITQQGFVSNLTRTIRGAFLEDVHVDYVFHCAAVTTSKTMVQQPVETIHAALSGTRHLLAFAASQHVESFVYLSSMEVYGDMSVYPDTRATEDRLGYCNPQVVRSNYPESKRMCENMCTAYFAEYGVPVKVARLAQTFGAGILPWENRVFAQFARSVIEKKDIVLHTKGLSEGNYCYSADVMTGLIHLLLGGTNGEAYNVANERCHTTIADMAKLCADDIAGGKIRVVFDIPKENTYGYAQDTKLTLDSSKLRALGWEPKTDLREMYTRMIEGMREEKDGQ